MHLQTIVARWICAVVLLAGSLHAQMEVAPTPPLGWNSWDSYGLSITAAEWKANVDWFHSHLQPAGWQYVVLDEGWYLAHPENAGGKGDQGYTLNDAGQFVPALQRFPAGIDGLAADAHALGLKFGIHILRGIPKQAVKGNLPIAGSALRAADAADTTDTCRWNPDNFGIRDNEAGQRYYDALLRMYAGWGVDFLKVDCIAKPYNTHEIRMIRAAIEKTGRPIVLSVSPGPTPLTQATDVSRSATLWRISDDVWDVWSDPKLDGNSFPETIRNQFGVLAQWMRYQSVGHWPDADMLPIGTLGPRPGWGAPRVSRLSPDETQSLLTLWAMARCPLIVGANLPLMPPALLAMLTNADLLAVDQHSRENHEVLREGDTVVWRAAATVGATGSYVAVFNLADHTAAIDLPWMRLGLTRQPHSLMNLWTHKAMAVQRSLSVTVPEHGSVLIGVR